MNNLSPLMQSRSLFSLDAWRDFSMGFLRPRKDTISQKQGIRNLYMDCDLT